MVEGEYLIDTNIFLDVLLEQDNREDCLKLLELVEDNKIHAIITSFSLHSIAVILERLKGLDAYKQFLEIIINFDGLMIYSTTPYDEIEVCKIAKRYNLSFDDSLHYYVANIFNLKIISFDKDFDKTDIVRITPDMLV